jgi:Fe2+ or Zn2+ uptake regulation protein
MAKDTNTPYETELRAIGLRVTAPRTAILAVLHGARSPLSIEEILSKLPKRSADQATVYRTLESFKEKGVVHEVVLTAGRTLYEITGDEHHHIVCTKCGRIEDIHLKDCGHFEKEALAGSNHFRKIERHALELYGTCNTCA